MWNFTELNIQEIIADAIRKEAIHGKNGSEMVSQVWKFTHKNKDFALKITQAKSNEASNRLSKEHEFIQAFHHPNSVQYAWHGCIQIPATNRPAYALITHWLPGSVLHTVLQETAPLFSSYEALQNCFYEFELLINELHRRGILHRDLWSKNIIFYKSTLFLFDFGWACDINEKTPYTPIQMRNPDDKSALKVLFDELEHHFKNTSKVIETMTPQNLLSK